MSLSSGFFDALETSNGVFDRTYSSADYCDNLATIINNGVRYSSEDDLKVSAGGDMTLTVNPGRAWINGHYLFNDIEYNDLTVDTAPTGVYSRIDRVVARLDTSITARSIILDVVKGTASENPAAPDLTRSGTIYEISLATITLNAGVTSITDSMITDTRADATVCGWASAVTGKVSEDLAELKEAVDAVTIDDDYIYTCNGATDNVELSAIAAAWLNGGTDYATKKIRVVGGNIGVTAANSGSGTQSAPFNWFNLGVSASTNRRIIFDFSNAGAVELPIESGTYNNIFAGNDITIIGAQIIANQTGADTNINGFSESTGAIYAENCRFWINASLESVIASNGTFRNCRGSIAITGANAFCFNPAATGIIRVFGGEYYAYTTTETSAVLSVNDADAVGILYAVNCPSATRTGFEQSYAVTATAGKVSITDTITILDINAPSGVVNVRGTLAVNKPGLM